MKKGELLVLNKVLGGITVPEVSEDDFYKIITCKVEISTESDKIIASIEKMRTEAEGDKLNTLINRFLDEQVKGDDIYKKIPKSVYQSLCKGITIDEAMLLKKYLIKDV